MIMPRFLDAFLYKNGGYNARCCRYGVKLLLYFCTINPAKLIEYLHIGIQKKGGQIWYNQRVTDLAEKQGNYWIALEQTKTKEKQLIVGKKVISAVGPYTGELLKKVAPYFKKLIDPQRVFLAFFKPTKAQFDSYTPKQKEQLFNGYPVINSMAGTRQGSFFSMIEKIDKQGIPLIKIGGHFQRSPIKDLDKIWTKN